MSPYFDTDTKPMTEYILKLLKPQVSPSIQFKFIIMGDLNSHMNILLNNVDRNISIRKEDHLLQLLLFDHNFTDSLKPFHEEYLSSTKFHSYQGNSVAATSRIDYILLSPLLLPNLFYASNIWPDSQVSNSDHSFVKMILLTENLFDRKAAASLKQHNNGRSVINYKSIDSDQWTKFKEDSDSNLASRFTEQSLTPYMSMDELNKSWNFFVNSVRRVANTLPSRKIYSDKRKPLPELLNELSEHWSYISKCLRYTTHHKLTAVPPKYPELACIHNMNTTLSSIAPCYNLPVPQFPTVFNLDRIIECRSKLRSLKKTLLTKLKVETQLFKSKQINLFFNRRCVDYTESQSRMIDSILSRSHDKIVIDKLEVDNELVSNPEDIKHYTALHFQNVVGPPDTDGTIPDEWSEDYTVLPHLQDELYQSLYDLPTFDEWYSFLKNTPNNKAPGPSNLSYDLLKHLGQLGLKVLHNITCACFILQDIPKGWKRAAIYPIPKPTDWNYNLSNTRPITLLETPRKLMVKILNSRLSKVLVSNKVLQDNQFAGLPGGSTLSPIAVVQHIIDDARQHNKELWLYLQDMSKCYDRVDLRILRLAMTRLKIPDCFINLTLSLFQNRRNYVITDVGVTDDYDVLIGIDQSEVISPLLWCIYYDPLLTRINSLRRGYNLTHTYQTTVNDPTTTLTKSVSIPAQAYMDDTLWYSDSQDNLQTTLAIANSFYKFTNIKTNDSKACLMTTSSKPYHPPGAPVGDCVVFHSGTPDENKVKIQPYRSSVRYLGVWISLDYNGGFVYKQAKSIINNAVATMANAKLTDNQLLYINNRVLIPLLEYRTQMSVISKQKCTSIMAGFVRLSSIDYP